VVTKSEPDGYTLLVQSASHAANSAIYKNLPYDPLKDLIDVARLGVTPYVMVTAPMARTKRSSHWWRRQRPIPAISVCVGGRWQLHASRGRVHRRRCGHQDVACAVPGLAGSHPGHYCGRNGFLHGADQYGGWAGERAAPHGTWPLHAPACRCDAQCCAAGRAGFADYDVSLWFGMWAPAGTPPSIVQKLNSGVASALQTPTWWSSSGKLGIGPLPMKPEEFASFVRSEIAIYQRIVKQAGIPQQ